MELGTFSVSLAVKDITRSKAFYEVLGFNAHEGCGSVEDKWLIMQNGQCIIGLFEGMFKDNILTFNPSDVRVIAHHLKQAGVALDKDVEGDSGPGHCVLKDPDGNVIMFDQF
ncbi:VOC family protein [Alteromonas sp. CYL-A6]|uniref:VOC family protein n=1 Tax=Alteromonas nitratireducens TaxID=3390813 RepID=UPI0034A94498